MTELILEPMLALYVPPQQVRDNQHHYARALREYEQALSGFERETLARAWILVRATHELVIWPPPGVIAAACRLYQPRPMPPNDEQQRIAAALERANSYVAHYMKTSQVAKLAKREGWSASLRGYVDAAAWVQAQLICGVRHIGWDAMLAQDLGDFPSSRDAFLAYRRTIASQVENNRVRVNVPRSRIQQWREDRHRPLSESIATEFEVSAPGR